MNPFAVRRPPTPSLGFLPSSRHQREQSTSRLASQASLRSAHSVSHAPDGLLLLTPCELVSSRSHVQGSLFRGFGPTTSRLRSSRSRALSPFTTFPCNAQRALRQVWSSRPQGFDPAADPLLPTSCLGLPTPDPLLSFHSRGFFSEHRGDTVAPPPLMTFPVDPSSDLDSGLQRITSVRPALLSPEDSPVRALWPSFCDALSAASS